MVSHSPIPWWASNLLIPLLVAAAAAYLSVHFRLWRERQRRISQEKEEWLLQLVAINQRLYWECSKLPSNVSLDQREIPTPQSKYGEVDEIAHLDEIMVELMEHFSRTPPEVDNDLREAVFQLQKSFDHPDTEAPLTTNYFKTDFRRKVEEIMGSAASQSDRVESSHMPL